MRKNNSLLLGVIISILVFLSISFLSLFPANASTDTAINVYINGNKMHFNQNADDPPPYIKNGRTLIPFRRIFETFGMEVVWNGSDRSITAKNDSLEMQLIIGQKYALVNNIKKDFDVAPEITGNRTFVPLRFVSESIGANVKWDASTQSVFISFPQNKLRPGQESTYNDIRFSIDSFESQNDQREYVVFGRVNSKDARLLIEVKNETMSFSGVSYILDETSVDGMYQYSATIYVNSDFTPKNVYIKLFENNEKVRVAEYIFYISN
ncbi:copper amine oxidase N-terminal domain-containing protein [Herbivorax sp. ANBcel31]|uniref:copper amine oxidase N-terminal domain-containing protein n=1 Tax=Herbivorax sp. ANBcel31 TaxID=3069754 RepID=UPI0027AF4882|nr:copper amine oxidase N-terminal domain-containing protein [Herbivorax sp. ANBcel31]MDQ2087096.1 copper amine oxidase N-terminal domain-containing protein [Herbivorax sp. ANBcel31]